MARQQQMFLPGIDLSRDDALSPPEAAETGIKTETGAAQSGWPPLHDMLGSLVVFEPQRPSLHPIMVLGLPIGCTQLPKTYAETLAAAHAIAAEKALLQRFFSATQASDARQELIFLTASNKEADLRRIEALHGAGKDVVVLAEGDPLFFGLGGILLQHILGQKLQFYPAPSILQEACARVGLPWHTVQNFSLRNGHSWQRFNAAVGSGKPLCVLTDASATPDCIAGHLLNRGADWFKIFIFEGMGTDAERQQKLNLAEAAAMEPLTSPCVMLLCPTSAARQPHLGMHDRLFPQMPPPTLNSQARSVALGLLQMAPHHVFWDVGSGTGALALEAASITHTGCSIAIEPSTSLALGIQELRRRYAAVNMEICTDEAPQCFTQLPRPHRIFVHVDYSSPLREDLLLAACAYLAPGGSMVIHCKDFDAVFAVSQFYKSEGWQSQTHTVQTACNTEERAHLASQTPIFLLHVYKDN